jgi:glycosyltransferase involved in cell wall biosynthesis
MNGLSVIAHADAELGVGESSRRLYSLLQASGLKTSLVPFRANGSRRQHATNYDFSDFATSPTLISAVNPDQLGHLLSEHPEVFKYASNHIGFWAWELPDFPDTYRPSVDLVDEIWTISGFCKEAISKSSSAPVRRVSLPVPLPSQTSELRKTGGSSANRIFTILVSFDYFSDVRRKNPAAAIASYLKAFSDKDRTRLILKSINGDKFPFEQASLRELAKNRADIFFQDGYLTANENAALVASADVYLSLHRSEGYGINLADAMARSIAVIATGYSGNLEFMDDEASILVPFELVPLETYAGLRVNSQWAEPDCDFVAKTLRSLYENPSRVVEVGQRGRAKIAKEHSLPVLASRFRKEFCE